MSNSGKVVSTRGLYAIELTEPVMVNGVVTGHRTSVIATYRGERWRAKHHSRWWARKYDHGVVTVRWIAE